MSYLRTNYRITGKELNYDAIGGGVREGAWGGGGGTNRPFGGFMAFSAAISVQERSAGITAGLSGLMVESTYGLMSLYYGSGQFGAGYKFWPFGARVLSMSDVAITDLSAGGNTVEWQEMKASDSIMVLRPFRRSQQAVSTPTSVDSKLMAWNAASMCTMGLKVLVWGWIVSGP